jgi:hypothetical protein
MAIRNELSLRLPNSPGALAGVCRALSDERVNILAMTLEAGGTLRLVVDNDLHALETLRERHYQAEQRDVLYTTLPNEPGALGRILRTVADSGVNLDYAYATTLDTASMVGVVIGVADAQRASAAAGI